MGKRGGEAGSRVRGKRRDEGRGREGSKGNRGEEGVVEEGR